MTFDSLLADGDDGPADDDYNDDDDVAINNLTENYTPKFVRE